MPGQEVRVVPQWAQQLAGLMVLGCCVAISRPGTKSRVSILSSVESIKPVKRKLPKKEVPSSEVEEFLRLPPPVQRQVLDYARNWIYANFEAKSLTKTE